MNLILSWDVKKVVRPPSKLDSRTDILSDEQRGSNPKGEHMICVERWKTFRPQMFMVASSTMNDEHNCDSQSETNATNVMGALQRLVGAKFKVLRVQLKIPHYSLHQIMADAVARVEKEERTFHMAGASNASGSDKKVLNNEGVRTNRQGVRRTIQYFDNKNNASRSFTPVSGQGRVTRQVRCSVLQYYKLASSW
jgi:hypothetical protein